MAHLMTWASIGKKERHTESLKESEREKREKAAHAKSVVEGHTLQNTLISTEQTSYIQMIRVNQCNRILL